MLFVLLHLLLIVEELSVISLFYFLLGAPRKEYKGLHDNSKKSSDPNQRSYIDIDATDPFKVPKHSQYIDRPVPEWAGHGGERSEFDDHDEPPPKGFNNFPYDMKHTSTNHEIDRYKGGPRFRGFKQNESNEERDRYEGQGINDREQANETNDFNKPTLVEDSNDHSAKVNLGATIEGEGSR